MDRLLSARLVGRAEERRELLAAVDAARRPGALVLLGEAGIGKSRLLREARQRAHEQGLPLMWGRATAGAGPFGPVQEAVAAGFRALDAPARRELLPVRAVLAQLAGEWTGEARADLSPLAVAEALLRFLAVTTRDSGAVVVLEDLHWAERETLTVARYLLDNVDDHGALCLLSLRPEPGEALTTVRRLADTRAATVLELGPLADAEVDDLVLACLGTDAAPGALLDFVRAHADGVPFVVEELLAGLARTGGLLRVDGG